MSRWRWLVGLFGVAACSCAPCPGPATPLLLACPADTTAVDVGGRRACVETQPVSRSEYRMCANADRRCEPPPFRGYLAWGADHGELPMPAPSEASARAYCAFAGRRLATSQEWREPVQGQFRCVAEPGSHARTRPLTRPVTVTVAGLNRSDGLDSWMEHGVFAAPLLAPSGAVTCAKIRVERGPGATGTLVWPPMGALGERRFPFEMRSGILRFNDPATGLHDDWAVGDEERAGGAIYVAGSPWIPGDLECSTDSPALRPLAAPLTAKGVSDQGASGAEDKAASFTREARVMYLRAPTIAGAAPSRCARVGLIHGEGSQSAALRIDADEGDRFYMISEFPAQERVFVAAAEDVTGRSGALPTGLLPLRSDAAGWHLGDATLHVDEGACEKEPPRPPSPEANAIFRRDIFAAWITLVRARTEVFWVDPSGESCERVQISAPDGFPLTGTLQWTPAGTAGKAETASYRFVVDADGLWLQDESKSPAAACTEHHEIRGLTTHGDGLLIGGSAVFDSLSACEAERPRTMPFVHRCPALAERSRPGPVPAGSIAARGGLDGFTRSADNACEPVHVSLRTGFSARTTGSFPPPFEGIWTRGREALEVYEWPYSKRLFRRSRRIPGAWVSAEPRADGAFLLGDDVIYPTEKACRTATK